MTAARRSFLRLVVTAVTVVTVVTVTLGCSGCGRPTPSSDAPSDNSGPSATSSTSVTTVPLDPPPDAVVVGFPAATRANVLSSPPEAGVSLPWHTVARTPDGTMLDLVYIAGSRGCDRWVGFTVAETADSVTIGGWASRASNTPACGGPLVTGRALVPLSKPLGTRVLRHPAVDRSYSSPYYFSE